MSELMQGIGPRSVEETHSITWITSATTVISAGLTALFALWAATGHDEVVLAGAQPNGATANPIVGATDEVEIDYETEVPIAASPSQTAPPPARARPTVRPAPSAPKAAAPISKPVAATGAS